MTIKEIIKRSYISGEISTNRAMTPEEEWILRKALEVSENSLLFQISLNPMNDVTCLFINTDNGLDHGYTRLGRKQDRYFNPAKNGVCFGDMLASLINLDGLYELQWTGGFTIVTHNATIPDISWVAIEDQDVVRTRARIDFKHELKQHRH